MFTQPQLMALLSDLRKINRAFNGVTELDVDSMMGLHGFIQLDGMTKPYWLRSEIVKGDGQIYTANGFYIADDEAQCICLTWDVPKGMAAVDIDEWTGSHEPISISLGNKVGITEVFEPETED